MMAAAIATLKFKPCPDCEDGQLVYNGKFSVCNECGHEDLCEGCGGTGRIIDSLSSWRAWEPVEVPCDMPDCPGGVI